MTDESRLLFESDIPAAMQLKEAAGWNQTEDDWRRLLMLEPNGCFAAIKDGRLVGTTTTTTYGNDLAWIGMVLVDPQYRRQGIASEVNECRARLSEGQGCDDKAGCYGAGKTCLREVWFRG